ncbi:MAG: HAD family hydrolase [Candidatus Obscuribacter sp.]|nr:HAD family hydrolase [Candidatus Obscuribacter sp.]
MTNQSVSHPAAKTPRKRNARIHTKAVFTDMDATMGSFWYYFCPAMNKIAPILAAKLGVEQKIFEMEVGRVMHLRGTHEWPWVMEETFFRRNWTGTPQSFRKEISEPFWAALDEARGLYLRPFDDVHETIDTAVAKGVRFAIVSDAPFYMALTRACDLGLDGKIEALYALDAPPPTSRTSSTRSTWSSVWSVSPSSKLVCTSSRSCARCPSRSRSRIPVVCKWP